MISPPPKPPPGPHGASRARPLDSSETSPARTQATQESASLAAHPGDGFRVPDDFEWGSATAAYQVESGLHGCDWHQWEEHKDLFGRSVIANGDRADEGPDFAHVNPDGTPGGTFRETLAAAKAAGMNSFRFSLDWSRLQPTHDGPYDPNALRLYHAILDECRDLGLKPMVTLVHFVLPTWVQDIDHPEKSLGGWTGQPGDAPGQAPIIAALAKFAGDMAAEFGDKIDTWVTLNEPNVDALGRYLGGGFPTAKSLPSIQALRVAAVNMTYAHAAAYDAIKANDRFDADKDGAASRVGIAQHVRRYEPLRPGSQADREAAQQMDGFLNASILDAAARGDADFDGDGRFDGPQEGRQVEALKDRLDFVGINYYTREKVIGLPFKLKVGWGALRFKGLPVERLPFIKRFFLPSERTEMDWEIHPKGMYDSLMWAARRYGRPLYVTENGIADSTLPDVRRPRFVLDHISEMQRAMRDGADVRGYEHWSLTDNFEWNSGFRPRFGLFRVDYTDPARPLSPTQGLKVYEDIIRNGGVTPQVRATWEKPGAPDDTSAPAEPAPAPSKKD